MAYLELNHVDFHYPNGYQALEDVNIAVEQGESVAIIGQNGAGKTTLVKLINGLLRPSQGKVTVDGWDTQEKTAAQMAHRAGYVFQNPDDQIFHNKVWDEVAFAPKAQKMSGTQLEERVLWAAELAGIDCYLDENPYNLPYSTRKFVSIASVMALAPDVLILDEPSAGQDLQGMNRLAQLIDAYKTMGKTILTITHDMEFVAENFDRTIVMANKRKIDDGPTREVFWKQEILEQAALRQPCVSGVAQHMGLQGHVLSVEDLVEALAAE